MTFPESSHWFLWKIFYISGSSTYSPLSKTGCFNSSPFEVPQLIQFSCWKWSLLTWDHFVHTLTSSCRNLDMLSIHSSNSMLHRKRRKTMIGPLYIPIYTVSISTIYYLICQCCHCYQPNIQFKKSSSNIWSCSLLYSNFITLYNVLIPKE